MLPLLRHGIMSLSLVRALHPFLFIEELWLLLLSVINTINYRKGCFFLPAVFQSFLPIVHQFFSLGRVSIFFSETSPKFQQTASLLNFCD